MNISNSQTNDVKKLNIKTRKFLTIYGMHHPKADVDQLYLPRNEGGRGLIQIELSYKIATAGLETYLRESKDRRMKLVLYHDKKKKLYSAAKEADKFRQDLGIEHIELKETDSVTKKAKLMKDIV